MFDRTGAGNHSWRSWVFIGFVSLLWWNFAGRRIVSPELAESSRLPVALLAAGFAASRLGGHVLETAAYFSWWRGRGVPVHFQRMLSDLVALSLIDLATLSLFPPGSGDRAAAPAWAVWIAGPRVRPALAAALGPGLLASFGSLGLATLARLIGTAHVQRAHARVSWRSALALTAAVWLCSRLALWWILDLARGPAALTP